MHNSCPCSFTLLRRHRHHSKTKYNTMNNTISCSNHTSNAEKMPDDNSSLKDSIAITSINMIEEGKSIDPNRMEDVEEDEEMSQDMVSQPEDEADEEEVFFTELEEKHNKELDESTKHTASVVPTLLRAAMSKKELDEEVQEEKKEEAVIQNSTSPGLTEEEVAKRQQERHRVKQLDTLLSKAAEYSNFIAKDLQELQEHMAAEAEAKAKAAEAKQRKKKRKINGLTEGEIELAKAQQQHELSKMKPKSGIFSQPPNLSPGCELKDYQLEGIRWLVSLYENGVSGILADEMGLGKTIQVIALIAHLLTMKVTGPFIIVAPLATISNWEREFKKWLPSLPVLRFHGNAAERDHMLRGPLNPKMRKNPNFPVIVTSYEMAIREQNKLCKLGEFTFLVVDEGQRLKNHRCTLITSLKRIPASNRLLLSGTPIQNNLDELFSLLNFVNPAIFDDLSVFQSWFGFRDIGKATTEKEIVQQQLESQTVSKLHEILRPFLLRRVKRDVLCDLPPKKELVVYAGMSKIQLSYADMIEKHLLKDTLTDQGIDCGGNVSHKNKLMNHRKNANHPFLFGEPIDPDTGLHIGTKYPHLLVRASGKFALLDRMLDRLFKDGHQVLIFSQMTRVLNIMEDYLNWRNWKYCRIDGTTKIDERVSQMDVFNAEKNSGKDGGRNQSDDRVFVFLLSTRAGGLGINLASADTCILFDSDWNPTQDAQAMDRCHRIGQTRPVAVYRLLTAGSVDIDMMEKQISKKKLERMAIVGGDFRKAGSRSQGDFSTSRLTSLLADDIKDLQGKGGDVEHVKIDEEELAMILDRNRLFGEGENAVPTEGKMYDIVEAEKNDALSTINN